jgi:hypothetical protein
MKIGLKEKITLRGVIRTYTRRQYPGDIYLTESHLEKHTIESLKQLLVGYINQRWLKRFLVTSGTAGFALLALYFQTPALIAVYLSAVLVLTSLTAYKT